MRHAAAITPPGCAATPGATLGAATATATASADTLIGNVGTSHDGTPAVTASPDLAQAFTAGTNANGHELTGIKVKFGTILGTLRTTGSNATFTAPAADGPSSRSTVVANLTNSSTCSTSRHEPRRDTVNGRTPHG